MLELFARFFVLLLGLHLLAKLECTPMTPPSPLLICTKSGSQHAEGS